MSRKPDMRSIETRRRTPAYQEGASTCARVAERMGHGVEMLERHYAHEIRDYRGRRIDVAKRSHASACAREAPCGGWPPLRSAAHD